MTEVIKQSLEDEITLEAGGDYHETIILYENDGVTPKNTTGYTMTLWIRKQFPNGELFDTLSTDGTRIVHTPASGQFNINFTATEIGAYNWTAAMYRMILDYGDGSIQVFRRGIMKVV